MIFSEQNTNAAHFVSEISAISSMDNRFSQEGGGHKEDRSLFNPSEKIGLQYLM